MIPSDSTKRGLIVARLTMARDALNRARDGLPELEDLQANTEYPVEQLRKSVSYILTAYVQMKTLDMPEKDRPEIDKTVAAVFAAINDACEVQKANHHHAKGKKE